MKTEAGMTFTLPEAQAEQLEVLAKQQGLTAEELLRTVLIGYLQEQQRPPRTRSYLGALKDLGPMPSAEDIAECRREMWANFPRTEFYDQRDR